MSKLLETDELVDLILKQHAENEASKPLWLLSKEARARRQAVGLPANHKQAARKAQNG